jgi:hypothetical protein
MAVLSVMAIFQQLLTVRYNANLERRMAGFNEAWAAVNRPRRFEAVSSDLQPLLRQVYFEILRTPPDLAALKESLTALLEYLGSKGRTNANCWAVDMFFSQSEGWERDWTEQHLPEDFHDVLAYMGEALHDTVRSPQVAANFDCLPEQLLDRVRCLNVPSGR